MDYTLTKLQVEKDGFAIVGQIYTNEEISAILEAIENADTSADTFRKSAGLFAIRQFLKEVPCVFPLVFNTKLRGLLESFGEGYFVVKSIYFDKSGESNWFVAYHQDLTISVTEKHETRGYGPWTVKQGQYAVQPPLDIVENIVTLRIHLDETTAENGALRVVAGSHAKGIYRPETIDWQKEAETACEVPKGGVMIMKPLLLHSSSRTVNNNRRRVLHIEFGSSELHGGLQWAERMAL